MNRPLTTENYSRPEQSFRYTFRHKARAFIHEDRNGDGSVAAAQNHEALTWTLPRYRFCGLPITLWLHCSTTWR